jgi:ubiquinone/menaquinone biosynthesis C-methylase UbiE
MANVEMHSDVLTQYDGYYDGQSEWRRLGAMDKAANVITLCRDIRVSSVLEIGAGDGAVLSRLSELGFGDELSAVEVSRSGLSIIQSRTIPRLVECRIFDGYRLPWTAGRFDLAILTHVLEHVEHPRQILHEAARVARYVFIEVPTEDISRKPGDYTPDTVGHINFFSPRTIRWLVQSCGLRVLRQMTTNPSKAVHACAGGRQGVIRHHIKGALLRWLPALATRHFCYHEALLATGSAEGVAGPSRQAGPPEHGR